MSKVILITGTSSGFGKSIAEKLHSSGHIVIGTSKKTDERRVPIHPEHLNRLPEHIRRQLIFEEGYGKPFNIKDEDISALTGGIASRSEILADIGCAIIAKPILSDFKELKSLCFYAENYNEISNSKNNRYINQGEKINLQNLGKSAYANKNIDQAVIKNIKRSNMSSFNCPEEVYLAEKLIEMNDQRATH